MKITYTIQEELKDILPSQVLYSGSSLKLGISCFIPDLRCPLHVMKKTSGQAREGDCSSSTVHTKTVWHRQVLRHSLEKAGITFMLWSSVPWISLQQTSGFHGNLPFGIYSNPFPCLWGFEMSFSTEVQRSGSRYTAVISQIKDLRQTKPTGSASIPGHTWHFLISLPLTIQFFSHNTGRNAYIKDSQE